MQHLLLALAKNILEDLSLQKMTTLAEQLGQLGYQDRVTVGSQNPNFNEVSKILAFLCRKFGLDLPFEMDESRTAADIPFFLNSVALLALQNVGVQLDRQKLLKANQEAVPELQKLTKVLLDAYSMATTGAPPPEMNVPAPVITTNTTLSTKAASLYDLLSKADILLSSQNDALDRANKTDATVLKPAIDGRVQELSDLARHEVAIIDEAVADQESVRKKLSERSDELERGRGRLEKLEHVRPAFLDELRDLESKLETMHADYVSKFMVLDYLKAAVADQEVEMASQQQVADDQLHQLRSRARQDQVEHYLDDGSSPGIPPDLEFSDEDDLDVIPERTRPMGDRAESRLGHRARGDVASRVPPADDDLYQMDDSGMLDGGLDADPLDNLDDSGDEMGGDLYERSVEGDYDLDAPMGNGALQPGYDDLSDEGLFHSDLGDDDGDDLSLSDDEF